MRLDWTNKINKTIFISSIVFISLLLFFYFAFYGHLQFLEQYQLLLYTPQYIGELFSRPGGLSDLIGRFLTQFCYTRQTGALAIALLFLGAFIATLYVGESFTGKKSVGAILVPTAMIFFLTNEYAQLSFIVAITLAMVLYLAQNRSRSIYTSYCLLVIFTILGYWLIGPANILFVVLAIANIIIIRRYEHRYIVAIATLLLHFTLAIISYRILPYRLQSMLLGVDYLRYTIDTPMSMWLVYLMPFVSCIRYKIEKGWLWVISYIICGTIVYLIHKDSYTSEQFKEMDYWVRCGRWDKVIKIAEKEGPRSQLSLVYLNLSLGMEGQLTNRFTQFPQLGTRGLLNDWKRDCISALPLAEVMYRVGNMNTALRYTVEAMEANSDFEKSGRALERMAEINMINGEYAVARKYCMILRESAFYKKRAEKILDMISHPETIDQHPVYGYMRRVRYSEDFIFNKYKFHPEEAMKHLAMQNEENRLARDYYIVWQNIARNEKRTYIDDEQVR
ncbi:MAG: DUF6057 family protein [Bacteroidia bacterium]|nr:DUF6057 family protein [Bacteroidia bacterium]